MSKSACFPSMLLICVPLLELLMCSMHILGKVILGSGYHTYNGIAVAHGACTICMYIHSTYTYGTII